MQVSHIDVTKQSPCAWGTVICFSLYGGPEVDLRADTTAGERQNMLWVDTMLGDKVRAWISVVLRRRCDWAATRGPGTAVVSREGGSCCPRGTKLCGQGRNDVVKVAAPGAKAHAHRRRLKP